MTYHIELYAVNATRQEYTSFTLNVTHKTGITEALAYTKWNRGDDITIHDVDSIEQFKVAGSFYYKKIE